MPIVLVLVVAMMSPVSITPTPITLYSTEDLLRADWTARASVEITVELINEYFALFPPEPEPAIRFSASRTPPPPSTPPPPRTYASGVEQWRGLVETYFAPADVPWAMRVMACESGGDPNIKNKNSSASGLMQFIRSTWDWVAPPLGYGTHASGAVFDPEANIHAASWLFYNGGSSHWVCR